MTQQVTELIDALANRFGTTAAFLIQEMARYYIARTSAGMIMWLIATFAGVFVVMWCVKKKNDPDCHGDPDWYWAIGIIVFIATVFAALFAIDAAVDLIGWAASPTAGAIEKIVKML